VETPPFLFIKTIFIGMDWFDYYKWHKNDGPLDEVVLAYNNYIYKKQALLLYDEEYKKLGTNVMIIQENSYTLIQEGEHQYGLLQEI
jgi:hypothetical protein